MTLRTRAGLMLVAGLLAACGDAEPDRVADDRTVVPNDAARAACLTSRLADQAADELAELDRMLPASTSDEDPAAALRQQAARAAFEYARAYDRFARIQAGGAAHTDSAVNHAAGAQDSARYARRAAAYRVRVPEPGTVEGNAADAFQREFAALWNDADHPCNWEIAG